MIVGNGVRLSGNPNRFMAAPLVHSQIRSGWNKSGAMRNRYTNPNASPKDGIPSGMRHPQVWMLPKVAGGLASRFALDGVAALTGNLAGGLNGTADLSGTGGFSTADATLLGFLTAVLVGEADTAMSVTALGECLSSLVGSGVLDSDITSVLNALAALTGSSTITADAVATLAAAAALQGVAQVDALLAGAVAADAALAGSGVISTATVNAVTQAVAALVGTGTVPPATLTALAVALAAVAGTGTLGVSVRATGSMDATISLGAALELSPESLAASVKAALLDTELDGYTIEEIIKLTSAAMLGKSSGGATSPVFRSLDDSADRVSGTVDSAGNRTGSVLSP